MVKQGDIFVELNLVYLKFRYFILLRDGGCEYIFLVQIIFIQFSYDMGLEFFLFNLGIIISQIEIYCLYVIQRG